MLTRLLVENVTVIERAELDLPAGLICISGESGAGKTLLTQAVRLIAGEKAEAGLVGPHADETYVEAAFDDPAPGILADLADDEDEFVLARRLRQGGPTRALCCGRSCSAEQMRQAAGELISLTGQHAARRLVDPAVQLTLIDNVGQLDGQREDVGTLYREWRATEKALADLHATLADGVRRKEMLQADIEQVRALEPRPGEEEELASERDRLQHADTLKSAAYQAYVVITGEDGDGLSSALAPVIAELETAGHHDPELAGLAEAVVDAATRLTEAGRDAHSLVEAYDSDPGRLEAVEQRLSALAGLRRRFGNVDLASVIARGAEAEAELATLESGDERVEALTRDVQASEERYLDAARSLSQARKVAADELSSRCAGHLQDLGLTSAALHCRFEEVAPGPAGHDRVTMLLAVNAGVEPAPLDKGASGGELARVNLALLLSIDTDAGVYCFDEVDSGIGGDTAHVVAAKLKELSRDHQVIVVTHLAQIAVQADKHFLVRKAASDEATVTTVQALDSVEEREREIARLIGADADDADAARLAADLVRAAA